MRLLGVCKFHRGEFLSYWQRPTTADIGIRAFGLNQNDLLRELTLGMQSILIADDQDVNSITRTTKQWEVNHVGDVEILVLKWLDEVLYNLEIHDEFLVDCQPIIKDGIIQAQVSTVPKSSVLLELEIKAVTSHEFVFRKILKGEIISSEWFEIPTFEGPGWYSDVVFDI